MNACDVFLFAAGLGTRLRPATEKCPKPKIPLLGFPLGFYTLPYLKNLMIDKFVVNTFYLPEQIHRLYQSIDLNVQFSDESEFIRGSGGGLRFAMHRLSQKNPILALNADEVFFANNFKFLEEAVSFHLKSKNLATLVVKEHDGVGSKFGGIWCHENCVKDISKTPSADAKLKGWHFIGFQILSPEILGLIPNTQSPNVFYDVLIHHLKEDRVKIFPVTGDWYETGSLPDYLLAKKQINQICATNAVYQNFYKLMNQFPKSMLSDLS